MTLSHCADDIQNCMVAIGFLTISRRTRHQFFRWTQMSSCILQLASRLTGNRTVRRIYWQLRCSLHPLRMREQSSSLYPAKLPDLTPQPPMDERNGALSSSFLPPVAAWFDLAKFMAASRVAYLVNCLIQCATCRFFPHFYPRQRCSLY